MVPLMRYLAKSRACRATAQKLANLTRDLKPGICSGPRRNEAGSGLAELLHPPRPTRTTERFKAQPANVDTLHAGGPTPALTDLHQFAATSLEAHYQMQLTEYPLILLPKLSNSTDGLPLSFLASPRNGYERNLDAPVGVAPRIRVVTFHGLTRSGAAHDEAVVGNIAHTLHPLPHGRRASLG